MKITFDIKFEFGEQTFSIDTLPLQLKSLEAQPSDLVGAEGRLVVCMDGEDCGGSYSEPIVRLMGQWIRNLPWIIGGDPQTIVFRNSEHSFSFLPTGKGIEFALFVGDEVDVEEYVIEPVLMRLDHFVRESLLLAERLLKMIRELDESLLGADEDCRDFLTDLKEARQAWRDFQTQQR